MTEAEAAANDPEGADFVAMRKEEEEAAAAAADGFCATCWVSNSAATAA